jgi:hypothetical protein
VPRTSVPVGTPAKKTPAFANPGRLCEVRFLRTADIGVPRSELPLPALRAECRTGESRNLACAANSSTVRTAVVRPASHAARPPNGRISEAALQRHSAQGVIPLDPRHHGLCPLIAHCTGSFVAQQETRRALPTPSLRWTRAASSGNSADLCAVRHAPLVQIFRGYARETSPLNLRVRSKETQHRQVQPICWKLWAGRPVPFGRPATTPYPIPSSFRIFHLVSSSQ